MTTEGKIDLSASGDPIDGPRFEELPMYVEERLGAAVVNLACNLYDPDYAPDPGNPNSHRTNRATVPELVSFLVHQYQLYEDDRRFVPRFAKLVTVDAYLEGTIDEQGAGRLDLPGISRNHILGAVEKAHDRTQAQARGYVNGAPAVANNDRKIVAVADMMATDVHRGIKRASGDDYIAHPRGVAATTFHIFNQLQAEGHVIDDELINATLVMDLMHDATEEMLATSKYYRPDRKNDRISPLAVRMAFEMTDQQRLAPDIPVPLRLLTHERGAAWMPNYSGYIIRGSPNLLFALTKPVDNGNNGFVEPKYDLADIDPATATDKHRKWSEKLQLYLSSMRFLGTALPKSSIRGNTFGAESWGPRFTELHQEFLTNLPPKGPERQATLHTLTTRFNQYVYGQDESPIAA